MSLAQQVVTYSVDEVTRIAAAAYQSGVNAGYMMAVAEDMLEIAAAKKEQEGGEG